MMATTPSLPSKLRVPTAPRPTFLERVTKKFEALLEEGKIRLEGAAREYQAEMAWQNARRTPAPAARSTQARILAGIAVDLETGEWLGLQEGLNVFGADSVRVEQGRAEGSGAQAGKSYFSNDTLTLAGRPYLLKLFSTARFSTRVEVQPEVV